MILEEIFKHHPPKDDTQLVAYEEVRQAGLRMALVVEVCCPKCADRSAAIRKIREAVMTANAAIALEGGV